MNYAKIYNEKRYEPVERNKDGMRFVGHRFPIKDGISLREVMIRQFSKGNHFIKEFAKGDYRLGETLRIRLPADLQEPLRPGEKAYAKRMIDW